MSLLMFLITVTLFFFRYVKIYSTGNAATSQGEHAVYVSSGVLGFSIMRDKKSVPTPSATTQTQAESYTSDLMHGMEESWSHAGVSYFSGHFTVSHAVGLVPKSTVLPGSWGHVTMLEISPRSSASPVLTSLSYRSGKPHLLGRVKVPPHKRLLPQVRIQSHRQRQRCLS
jgi:hypothetical protein